MVNAEEACEYIIGKGVFAEMEKPVLAVSVFEDKEGNKVGQMQFNIINGQKAISGLCLSPDFLDKGLGHVLREKTLKIFWDENPGVEEIRSMILVGNQRAIRSIEKSGYEFIGYKEIMARKAVSYRLRKSVFEEDKLLKFTYAYYDTTNPKDAILIPQEDKISVVIGEYSQPLMLKPEMIDIYEEEEEEEDVGFEAW